MYLDDIKLFPKTEKELEILIQTVIIYIHDIDMDFDSKKMQHANNEKRKTTNDGSNRTTNSRKNQNA